MTVQVLLNPEFLQILQGCDVADSGRALQAYFDALDEGDRRIAELPTGIELPKDTLADDYEAAGLTALADKSRQGPEVERILTVRPLVQPMTTIRQTVWKAAFPFPPDYPRRHQTIAAWEPDTVVPMELRDLLARLRTAGVFGEIEVWQTPTSLHSPLGVLLVGTRPQERYRTGGDSQYYPIARWTAGPKLVDPVSLRRRQTASWVAPLLAILSSIPLMGWTLTALLFHFGWQDSTWLPGNAGAALLAGLYTLGSFGWLVGRASTEKEDDFTPDWANDEDILAPLLIYGVLSVIYTIASGIALL